jgi:hypothetical protein
MVVQVEWQTKDGSRVGPMTVEELARQVHLELLPSGASIVQASPSGIVLACGRAWRLMVLASAKVLAPIVRSLRFSLAPEQVLAELHLEPVVRRAILCELQSPVGRAKYGMLVAIGHGEAADLAAVEGLTIRESLDLLRLHHETGLAFSEILIHLNAG